MPIPPETRTLVNIEGIERLTCDARCVLTFQEQTGTPATLEAVTDYESRRQIEPSAAIFVTGSDTAPDVHTTAVRDQHAAAYLHWHRCLPSVLAFSSRAAAASFQREHGGHIMTLTELGFMTR